MTREVSEEVIRGDVLQEGVSEEFKALIVSAEKKKETGEIALKRSGGKKGEAGGGKKTNSQGVDVVACFANG